jgi:hypothetical protein
MASRFDEELNFKPSLALTKNRAKFKEAQVKFDGIQTGKIQPSRQGQARLGKNERLKTDLQGNEQDFDKIMGRASKAISSKVREEDGIIRDSGRKKGRSDSIASTLHIPIVRPQRLATPDGATSFHFSHDSVAKTRHAVVSESGRANRPGAAKDHNRYIERESAVAQEAVDDGMSGANSNSDRKTEDEKELAQALGIGEENREPANVETLKQETTFDRPLRRNFLRTFRATLGDLFADPESDPRGEQPDQVDGLFNVPGGRVVPDSRQSEMLLFSNEISVLGRNGKGDQGLRRERDGNNESNGRRREGLMGLLPPVPAWISERKKPENKNGENEQGSDRSPADKNPAKFDQSTAEGQGLYIERQEALAIQPDGSRVLFTNIDPDASKRAEFWRLVEEHEREADPDKMRFTVSDNAEFWKKVSDHKECPSNLKEFLENVDPSAPATFESGDNAEMRKFLSKIDGWENFKPKNPNETMDDYLSRRKASPVNFVDGRGGRIQYRIIGELPHELDLDGKKAILREFSEEFAKRKLPFVSVMHAPDHTNSDKNWHFHLVYYDRPASRITEEMVLENTRKRNEADPERPCSPNMDHVGKWDFTIRESYLRPGKNYERTNSPYIQKKVEEVAQDNKWIQRLRKRLADITNDHLERGGIERRVDHRRHSEMGIHNDPQEHLGTRLANLEAMGVATAVGVENETKQWTAMQQRMEAELRRRKATVDKRSKKWLSDLERASHLDDNAKAAVRGNIIKWHQQKTEAEENNAIADNIDQHSERLLSRANRVRETTSKQLKAIDEGKATRYQSSRADKLKHKSDEAMEWLKDVSTILEDEYKLARECRGTAKYLSLQAEAIELDIARALHSVDLNAFAEQKRRKREEEQQKDDAAERLRARDEREAGETRRKIQLSEKAMNDWIKGLVKENKRIVYSNNMLVPHPMNDDDQKVVGAANYKGMQARLVLLKKEQDKRVDELVKAISEKPENVTITRNSDGKEVYGFKTGNKVMSSVFKQWGDDPAIRKAVEAALEVSQGGKDRQVAAGNDNQVAAEKRPAAKSSNTLERVVIAAVNDNAVRIHIENGRASFAERDLQFLGITSADAEEKSLQKRLMAIGKVQNHEIARIKGYAKKLHRFFEVEEGVPVISVRADKEIKGLFEKWKYNDEVKAEIAQTVMEAKGLSSADKDRARGDTPPVAVAVEPVAPKITELSPDLQMREEARKRAAQRQEQIRAEAEAARKRKEPVRSGDSIAANLAGRTKSHPLIEEWVEAVSKGFTPEERAKITARLSHDKEAMDQLKGIKDIKLKKRIRDEIRQIENNQQLGLDFGMENTPKRS